MFSGEGVNRLRTYLNEAPADMYVDEATMFDDREGDQDGDTAVTNMMNATVINDDDEDMDEGDAADETEG